MSSSPDAIRVLHVDADRDSVDRAADSLEAEGERFDVRTATTVSEGLEMVADCECDCIVSAYQLPERGGLEFLEAVRDSFPDLPFILCTGEGSEAVASEAISSGVTDYFRKGAGPDQYATLADRIEDAVERYRADRRTMEHRRISTVFRKTNEALARARTQREIDEGVCEIISDAEPYRFAWIGEYDSDSHTVEPRAAAGVGEPYLEEVEITIDRSPTGQGPTGCAVRDRTLAVMQNISTDPAYGPWREEALERGYKSSAAVPLVHDDTLYGVLNVYADRAYAFDEHERRLLSNLGETIAHASHRVELQQQYTEQYRELFEEAPVMIVFTKAVDGEPIIEDCNQAFAERLGYTREELRETPLADYYTETATERLLRKDGYRRAMAGEFVREQRTLLTREGGEVLTMLRASPRRNQKGEITGTHALYLDITDQQLVTELKRKNERLDEFASVVSHDLRNPLNVAVSRLELLADECDSEHVDEIERAHDRIEALIEDLLRLARTEEQGTDPTALALDSVVAECWDTVETRGTTLHVETERRISADESQLKRLFENLIRNAIEHGPEDVTVTVGDLPDGFYVEDDGPGIPEQDRETVFETGYSTTRNGTGFGLRIVEQIVEAHGWEIRVTESTDGGARFEITGVEGAVG